MQARFKDDVPHVFVANYAVATFSLILAPVIVLVIGDLPHSPLLEVFIQLSYELYPSYHQQACQQKSNQHQSFFLLPDLDLDITSLFCYIIREST